MRKIILEAAMLLFIIAVVALAFFIVGQPQSHPEPIAQVTETTWQTTTTTAMTPTTSTTTSTVVQLVPTTSIRPKTKPKQLSTTTTTKVPAQSFLQVAQSQVGLSGPYTDGGFWCAKFVQWVGAQSNTALPAGDSPAHLYRDVVLTDNPKVGDLVFVDLFAGTQPGAPITHIGIVESIEGDTIHTIEGNADNSDVVVRLIRQIGDGYVKGFGSVSA